jgi:hypothetical protein
MRLERISDEHHDHAAPGSYWREPMSNSAAGLDGDRGADWQWVAVDPLGNKHILGHTVIENSDETISTLEHLADLRLNEHLGWRIEHDTWVSVGGDEEKPILGADLPPGERELRWAIAEERMRIGAEPPPLPKIEPIKLER